MINTERLFIRPFRPRDAEDVFEWRSDPEVNRFMPYPCDGSVEEVRQRLEKWIADNDKFAIELKGTGRVIGDISLEWSEKDKAYEIGYNICRSFWRNGWSDTSDVEPGGTSEDLFPIEVSWLSSGIYLRTNI